MKGNCFGDRQNKENRRIVRTTGWTRERNMTLNCRWQLKRPVAAVLGGRWMDWNRIVEQLTPHIVKIETPQGHGSGFVCLYNYDHALVGIATAYHVVEHAEKWQEPMRIEHEYSRGVAFLKEGDRFIHCSAANDSAVILFMAGKLDLPRDPIELLPIERRLPIGVDVGWLGYPGIGPQALCFFSGNISARVEHRNLYLIDGVAINGVSGGPVLYSDPNESVKIVGTISAYMVNRNTGEALPGLSIAQDVSHFHATVSHIRTLDEARQAKLDADQARAAEERIAQPALPLEPTPTLPDPTSAPK